VSPAEAVAVTEEPNWRDLWRALKAADDGYEVLLMKYRRWHWTPGIEYRDDHGQTRVQKNMGPSVDGVIALSKLKIFPPTIPENPLTSFAGEQHDGHMWFLSQGRAWRILGIEDKMLMLDSFGEQWQIDLNKAKWEKYCEAARKALEAMP
jgi:hypothetical protein